jgi:hypothetical protein
LGEEVVTEYLPRGGRDGRGQVSGKVVEQVKVDQIGREGPAGGSGGYGAVRTGEHVVRAVLGRREASEHEDLAHNTRS